MVYNTKIKSLPTVMYGNLDFSGSFCYLLIQHPSLYKPVPRVSGSSQELHHKNEQIWLIFTKELV